jgi:Ferredoxin-like domain in Api92-like protein
MPNWVHNEVMVKGSVNDLDILFSKITKPHDLAGNKKGEFTFHNIFSPEDVRAYNGTSVEEHDYHAIPNGNWYDWNCKHWGTKWDVADCSTDQGDNYFSISFDTPWSSPAPIIDWFINYCQQHGLDLVWSYEEEQGWGGTVSVIKGVFSETEYDIPNCHADYDSRGIVNRCVCEWMDAVHWFDDCPGKAEAMAEQEEAEEAEV